MSDSDDPSGRAEPQRKTSAARKQRKKRRGDPSQWQNLDDLGRERPRFLAAFPKHPELDKLSQAFEFGNYAYVRANAPKLAQNTDDPDVKAAALELAERIKPDPLFKYILSASVLLFLYLVIHAYTSHGH